MEGNWTRTNRLRPAGHARVPTKQRAHYTDIQSHAKHTKEHGMSRFVPRSEHVQKMRSKKVKRGRGTGLQCGHRRRHQSARRWRPGRARGKARRRSRRRWPRDGPSPAGCRRSRHEELVHSVVFVLDCRHWLLDQLICGGSKQPSGCKKRGCGLNPGASEPGRRASRPGNSTSADSMAVLFRRGEASFVSNSKGVLCYLKTGLLFGMKSTAVTFPIPKRVLPRRSACAQALGALSMLRAVEECL